MVHRSFTPIQTLEELKAEIQSWIRSKDYCDGSPLPYFKRIIEQFHLQSQVDIYDLVNELYLRGVKQLETKGPIEKPRPWFRSAAYNVARELSRSSRRYIQITPADENELASEELDENQISDSDRLALRESIQTLASKDRLILT
ncbi:RNA polymerase sigma factor [Leptolyngbya sp. FACHB-261]|uniref:RNA polymerase sigma factor n=1 Tax=Leptolyngbya sp. FACHB-261 TaxID=2692806 RepID=UPI001684720E|nr:sigma-70 family RNA polymerase sigma factor [Leptolyngbya sp. FACHB-261]MBD2101642.1 sigma-70 family RNA polymerase sigma factor [Leptolyngbya sp. FACHB-261]